MSGRTYYNEIDPDAAAWLEALIAAAVLPPGVVDRRSIWDVRPADLVGFTHCHFFAGIGGWAYALRLAGWPDDRPIWTGSCPCQPYSAAGKGLGDLDPRNLWPAWRRLIVERRPDVIAGEQVENAIGHGWLDTVATDLEAEGYAVGAVVLGAHSVGAPHRRQRLWFLADAERGAAERHRLSMGAAPCGEQSKGRERERLRADAGDGESVGDLAESRGERREGERLRLLAGEPRQAGAEAGRGGEAGELGDSRHSGLQERERNGRIQRAAVGAHEREAAERGGDTGFWSSCDWLPCRDGKLRPTQPGIFPLVARLPGELVPSGDPSESYANATTEARVGRLRGYGNAIVPPVAAEFIRAYLDGA